MRISWIIVVPFLSILYVVCFYLKSKNKKAKEEHDGRVRSITSGSGRNVVVQGTVRDNEQEKSKVS